MELLSSRRLCHLAVTSVFNLCIGSRVVYAFIVGLVEASTETVLDAIFRVVCTFSSVVCCQVCYVVAIVLQILRPAVVSVPTKLKKKFPAYVHTCR